MCLADAVENSIQQIQKDDGAWKMQFLPLEGCIPFLHEGLRTMYIIKKSMSKMLGRRFLEARNSSFQP